MSINQKILMPYALTTAWDSVFWSRMVSCAFLKGQYVHQARHSIAAGIPSDQVKNEDYNGACCTIEITVILLLLDTFP